MTKNGQLDLFILSNKSCECKLIKHALSEAEYEFYIQQVKKIKNIILDHGWDLSDIYYYYLDKLNLNCTAWANDNYDYLSMRARFQEPLEKVTIPLEKMKVPYH